MRYVSTTLCVALTLSSCSRSPVALEPVVIDGSSTLFPLSKAVADDFMRTNRGSQIAVTSSGTRDGLHRLCAGQIDIANASSPITADEQKMCAASSVEFIELPVAHDAVTVIVHPRNDWIASITIEELRRLWAPDAERRLVRWSQVRPGWPERAIALFGPGPESGTFDFFTSVIVGGRGGSRTDYTPSADDLVIVNGVAADEGALGYVGHTQFATHASRLKALAVDDLNDRVGRGPIEPTADNVQRGLYRPLSRPLFLYINAQRASRPEVSTFIQSYLRKARELSDRAAAIPLMATAYRLAERRFVAKRTGTMYAAPESAGMSVELLLTR